MGTAMHNITMPPRLNLYGASRSLAFRSRPSIISYQSRISPVVSRRAFADEKTPPTGPNEETLGHVSEEAADMSKIKGETGPDLGQGTPVQEIIERDQESKEKAPEIVKEEIEKTKSQADAADTTSFANLLALGQLQNVATGGHATDPVNLGHKFGLPDLPLPSDGNLKYRYDPVVSQVTTLLMKHGKLSVAQRNMSFILNQLRTAPLRQRRRQAVQWILDAANKKKSRGSGRGQFAQRFADEIISVVEGKSSVWEKRMLVHRTGTSARANLMKKTYRKRI